MENNYIRPANSEDVNLITSYFNQALAHYESQGELLAIQDIKYFLDHMSSFNFYLKEKTDELITYAYEFPISIDGANETGFIAIPLTSSSGAH